MSGANSNTQCGNRRQGGPGEGRGQFGFGLYGKGQPLGLLAAYTGRLVGDGAAGQKLGEGLRPHPSWTRPFPWVLRPCHAPQPPGLLRDHQAPLFCSPAGKPRAAPEEEKGAPRHPALPPPTPVFKSSMPIFFSSVIKYSCQQSRPSLGRLHVSGLGFAQAFKEQDAFPTL